MRKTALNTALWTTLVVSLGVSLSACSDGHEAVTAHEPSRLLRLLVPMLLKQKIWSLQKLNYGR